MDLQHMSKSESSFCFIIKSLVKCSKPNKEQPVLTLPKFSDEQICVYSTLESYLDCTANLRNSSKLFVSLNKPHGEISKDTVSRWVKVSLAMAGVDTNKFLAHSTRAAAISKAQRKNVPLTSI